MLRISLIASWTDIGASASPGYGGAIFVGANNPLSGRQGYVATSPSYPALNTVTVNLGTAYAGKTVQVRFRLGTDEAATDVGWQIDDLVFANLANAQFTIDHHPADQNGDDAEDGRFGRRGDTGEETA